MEHTKYQYLGASDQELELPQPPLERSYPQDATLIDLTPIEQIKPNELDLQTAIHERQSVRKYSRQPMSMEELAYLLWCTQGVKRVSPRPATMRTVPSAGARHALE